MDYRNPETGTVVKKAIYRNAKTGIAIESPCVIEGPGWSREAGQDADASPSSGSKNGKKGKAAK